MVEVNGREVNFKYSVGACIELARLCPEGDIANLMAYLNDSEAGRRAENRMRFVCILSLMGEKAAAFISIHAPRAGSDQERRYRQ